MANYCDITVLVDRSGSMERIKTAMESGFEEFVQGHRAYPSTRLTLVQFDGRNDQEVVYNALPIGSIGQLYLDPRGMTPLNDALCKTIDATGWRLAAMPQSERPDKVLFIIITDGLENASRIYTREDVKRRIELQQGTYSWEFVYLGANQDAIKEAVTMGMDWKKAISYNATGQHTNSAMRGLLKNTVNYVGTGSSATMDWSDKQRSETTTGSKS